ncbi:SDR family oxidoreductase [Proteiniclasticum sp. SCR006]|uniref:SDR family oxidoreductase n=1 Tax=Proteiniclasticum aestuarii TaxID=2817862 RepID=A0A939HBV1_9CLOT|nr:SDR family oxidoreductase [Proteiniclasticum aestuarii]MBO1265121.1 SDR family oxidoreductase [Proteiniclasticum aestuarii]
MRFELPEELVFLKNGRAKQKKSTTSMKGKTAVVTGATSGVGYEAVKALAAGGCRIILVARNERKAQAVKEELEKKYAVSVAYYIADFSDLASVRAAAEEILKDQEKIHVLVNSAGIHSTKKTYTRDGFEKVFCVNHLGSFLLTRMLLERMKASSPSRIIQVNSEGHRFNGLDPEDLNWHRRIYTGLRGYGASKTAQLLTVWQMAEELKGTGVTINAMHPGGVRTGIGSNNGFLYRWFLRHVTWHFLKDPVISGEAVYYLASAPEMEDVSGKFYNLTVEEKPAKHALSRKNQKKIWEKSLDMTGLSEEKRTDAI